MSNDSLIMSPPTALVFQDTIELRETHDTTIGELGAKRARYEDLENKTPEQLQDLSKVCKTLEGAARLLENMPATSSTISSAATSSSAYPNELAAAEPTYTLVDEDADTQPISEYHYD